MVIIGLNPVFYGFHFIPCKLTGRDNHIVGKDVALVLICQRRKIRNFHSGIVLGVIRTRLCNSTCTNQVLITPGFDQLKGIQIIGCLQVTVLVPLCPIQNIRNGQIVRTGAVFARRS